MKFARLPLLLILLFTTVLLNACGPSNTVPLVAPTVPNNVLPAPNAPRVSVVVFEDKRDSQDRGVRRDGTAFVGSQDVTQWVSQALADELRRCGLQVSYALTPDQARSGNPDFIVTGTLDKAWLREVSATELICDMSASYRVASRSGKLSNRESLNAGQTRNGLPSGDVAKDLMTSCLRDLVQPMARKIQTIIGQK